MSYGKYTDGHLFAKHGYINGDGSLSTEVSLAVFHRILGDVGLGQQFLLIPFDLFDPHSCPEIFGPVLGRVSNDSQPDEANASRLAAMEVLNVQSKELIQYLLFNDGYEECIDLSIQHKSMTTSKDKELKWLKWQLLSLIANCRDAWIVRVPPTSPDARPLQANHSVNYGGGKDPKALVGLNAERVISTC